MTTGSRIRIDGFADQSWDEELLERGEKPVGAEDEPFRVEIVGSNPAGPTKLLFAKNYKRKVAKRLSTLNDSSGWCQEMLACLFLVAVFQLLKDFLELQVFLGEKH